MGMNVGGGMNPMAAADTQSGGVPSSIPADVSAPNVGGQGPAANPGESSGGGIFDGLRQNFDSYFSSQPQPPSGTGPGGGGGFNVGNFLGRVNNSINPISILAGLLGHQPSNNAMRPLWQSARPTVPPAPAFRGSVMQ
jgi:hypothetical protein